MMLLVGFLPGAADSALQPPSRDPARQTSGGPARMELLLVSYAVTKAAYDRIIPLFAKAWKQETGEDVIIRGSYGGSGSQTQAVIKGLQADVVGLATSSDIQKLQEKGLIVQGWQRRLPYNSVPTQSTIVLFVRPGNPKRIHAWSDLSRSDVDTVLANPKTSGVARWNFVALWGAIRTTGGREAEARNFIRKVYKKAEALPKDARAATLAFVKAGRGDALLNWESEAILLRRTGQWSAPTRVLSPNILTEMPVAVVDRNADRKGTRRVAEAFARFLFTPEAQRVFVDNGFRPATAEGRAYAGERFPKTRFFRIADLGGWPTVDQRNFAREGLWDQLFGGAAAGVQRPSRRDGIAGSEVIARSHVVTATSDGKDAR